MQPTAFPQRLPTARISDINLSTPSNIATLATAMPVLGSAASVPANTINPDPVTPTAPLLVIISTIRMLIRCPIVRSTFVAYDRKMILRLR